MVEFDDLGSKAKLGVKAAPLQSLEEHLELTKVRPFSELIKDREAMPPGMPKTVYDSSVDRIPTDSTPQLLMRLSTATDPAVAWRMHCELTARDVPPVLRPRVPEDSKQLTFLAVAADVFWIATKHPGHTALFDRAKGLFKNPPGTEQWHKVMAFVYRLSAGRPHRVALALNLSDDMRCVLDTMATKAQNAARKAFRQAHDTIEEDLTAHALAHPDKSGVVAPEDVVRLRLELLRYFVLCGRSASLTADCLSRVANHLTLRRQVATRIEQIKARSAAAERALAFRI